MAKKLCDILKLFSDATELLLGSKYPTSNLYFNQIWEIKLLSEKESTNSDVLIRAMIHEINESFEKYWDLSFMQICVPVILDPRFKLGYLKFHLTQCFGNEEQYFPTIENTCIELFNEYSLQFGELTPKFA
jgi:hypothetical protein